MSCSKRRKHSKKIIHVGYTHVFNDVLKFEEVMDIDIDIIFQAYLKLLADVRKFKNLSRPPSQNDIRALVDMLIMKLNERAVT